MIFIAFCFFLVLFLIFLAILSKILGKIGNAVYGEKGKKIGGSILWVLLACFIVYQIAEYHYVKYQVQSICKKEAGLFIYVTPEQWKEENKEEWETLAPYENKYGYALAETMEKININGEFYKPRKVINSRVVEVSKSDFLPYTQKKTILYVDKRESKILVKWIGVSRTNVGTVINEIDRISWKIWLNGMGCVRWLHNFGDLETKYSNQSLTEQIGGSK